MNPAGVVAPAMNAVRATLGVVSNTLQHLEDGELAGEITLQMDHMAFQLSDARTQDERRASYRDWILAKCFQDFAKGLRESLEEAHVYIAVIQMQGHPLPNGRPVGELLQGLRLAANRLNFPDLLDAVNDGLHSNLTWLPQFLSLQKARNCLEHRNGIVSADKDVEHGCGALVLSIPRIQLFLRMGEREVELIPPMVAEGEAEVIMKTVAREMHFAVGEKITFSANDISEIGLAIWIIVSELAGKLPRLEQPIADA